MSSRRAALLALVCSCLTACGGGGGSGDGDDGAPAAASATAVALTASGHVASFRYGTSERFVTDRPVTGLVAGETLVGLDVRPSDGRVYALSAGGRVYLVDVATGAAVLRSTLVASSGDDAPFTGLAGTAFGTAFDPVTGALRVVGDSGQNLSVDVDTGKVVTDPVVTGASIDRIAYSNAFDGATRAQLWAIDGAAGRLYRLDPSDGTLSASSGDLAVASAGRVEAFTIDPRTDAAAVVTTVGGRSQLRGMAVTTGGPYALLFGAGRPIGGSDRLVGLAFLKPPPPVAVVLTSDDRIASFDPRSPAQVSGSVPIAGLGAGESAVGIGAAGDGNLLVLTSLGRILVVRPSDGSARLLSTLAADPADATDPFDGAVTVRDTFAYDRSTVDGIRILGPAGRDLRVVVNTGATVSDAPPHRDGTVPQVVGAAFADNAVSRPSLYVLDAARDTLAAMSVDGSGTVTDVSGPGLGLHLSGRTPFAIAGGDNGLALVALRPATNGPSSLYSVSLDTGRATPYRNTTGDPARSLIGGANGPTVVDLALLYLPGAD